VKDYDVTYRYANGVVMTCKPGNPSIKFIGTEGWVGNTGWRGSLSRPAHRRSSIRKIGPDEIRLYTTRPASTAISSTASRAARIPISRWTSATA
jgi:hypothetical protein